MDSDNASLYKQILVGATGFQPACQFELPGRGFLIPEASVDLQGDKDSAVPADTAEEFSAPPRLPGTLLNHQHGRVQGHPGQPDAPGH